MVSHRIPEPHSHATVAVFSRYSSCVVMVAMSYTHCTTPLLTALTGHHLRHRYRKPILVHHWYHELFDAAAGLSTASSALCPQYHNHYNQYLNQ